MYKAGIIGFGKMGMLHGALLSGSRKARIAALCDKSAVMRLGFKRVYKGVHTYNDAKKMLDQEKLDIVIVTTPTFNHEESVVMALESGCAVFVEKPLAITAEQASRIWKLSSEKKLPVQVGFCNRFFPSVSKAQELLEQNIIGSVEHIHAVMFIGDVFEEHTGWRYKPELSGGGALMDFGIHMIDLLIYFFGYIPCALRTRHLRRSNSAPVCAVILRLHGARRNSESLTPAWKYREMRGVLLSPIKRWRFLGHMGRSPHFIPIPIFIKVVSWIWEDCCFPIRWSVFWSRWRARRQRRAEEAARPRRRFMCRERLKRSTEARRRKG